MDKGLKIGVLGGGQLGMMMSEAAENMKLSLQFLDPDPEASVSFIGADLTNGSFKDKEDVLHFGKTMDILTVEIEHVSVEALKELETLGVKVFPQSEVLEMVQDKGLQKKFYKEKGLPTAGFQLVENRQDVISKNIDPPFVMKARKGGYDGKGVVVIRTDRDLDNLFDVPSVIEPLVEFEKEISVIVARNEAGEIRSFPPVEMMFDSRANLVDMLLSPARLDQSTIDEACSIAEDLIGQLEMVGVLAVEFFYLRDGTILINEIAPRPHNSGHQTIEGNITSQYRQHLLAISGQPLEDTSIRQPSVMINLLGHEEHEGLAKLEGEGILSQVEDSYLHFYHKKETRPFRKMGHVTVLADSLSMAISKAEQLKNGLSVVSVET